ncbi:MAG: glycosyltransferase family 4 protein [bacterium]|nr:glycosyltransferase family 4 protein [bacterium]
MHVALIQPSGYVHAQALYEVAETVYHGLRRMGEPTTLAPNELAPTGGNIVIGAHLLPPTGFDALRSDTILYNFEQLCDTSRIVSPAYLAALARCCTWDYSKRNLEKLERAAPGGNRKHVPLGHVPELERIESAPAQDIDVLFYGSVNERRARVLERLRGEGVNVHAVFGVYGPERDALIARSKLVLNLHFYPTSIFEIVRVSYLLANARPVVAECGHDTELEPSLRDAVELSAYDDLVPTCLALLADDDRRHALAQRGRERFTMLDESAILAQALNRAASTPANF